jgi:hypothetical protein
MQGAMNWWIRGYLLFAVLQGFGIGLTGMLLPSEMQIPLRLSPLNARFVAALYLAGAIGVLLAAFRPRRADARLFVIGFGAATLLILIITVLHWSEFMADALPHRAVWIFDYVVDPALALVLVPLAGLWPARRGTGHALTALLNVEAFIFGVLGLLLVLVPDVAAAYWPWNLSPVVAGQLYGCFFLTFCIGAFFAAREDSAAAVRNFLISSLGLALVVLLASVLHFDRFKPGPVTWVWFGFFGLAAVVFGLALLRQRQASAVLSPSAV